MVNVYGSTTGSSVGTPTSVKADFNATANRFRAAPVEDVVTSGLIFHLDPANAKIGTTSFTNGCASTDLSAFDLSTQNVSATLTTNNSSSTCTSAATGWKNGTFVTSGTTTPIYLALGTVTPFTTLQNGAYTLEAWFKPKSTPSGNAATYNEKYGIIMKAGKAVGLDYTSTGNFQYEALNAACGSGTNVGIASTSAYTTTGVYYHVVATIDYTGGNTVMTLYVNGTQNGTTTYSSNHTCTSSTYATYLTNPWIIGAAAPTAGSSQWDSDATFGPVRIYNRALSAYEVLQNCIAQKGRYGVTCKTP